MDARQIIIRPIISEKSYRAIDTNRYSFEVNYRATKPHIRAAVEEIFKVKVIGVQTINVKPKPKRRGAHAGVTKRWKKGSGKRDMAIKSYKPTSPGRRFATTPAFDEITKSEPEKALTRPVKRNG